MYNPYKYIRKKKKQLISLISGRICIKEYQGLFAKGYQELSNFNQCWTGIAKITDIVSTILFRYDLELDCNAKPEGIASQCH